MGSPAAAQRELNSHEQVEPAWQLVQFVDTSRPLCRRMLQEGFRDERVQQVLAQTFCLQRSDVQTEPGLFRELLGESGCLATLVLSPEGLPLAALRGYATAEHLLAFLLEAQREAPAWRAVAQAAALPMATPAQYLAAAQKLAARGLQALAPAQCERALAHPAATPAERLEAWRTLAQLAITRGEVLPARQALEQARAQCGTSQTQWIRLEQALAELERRPTPTSVP